MKEMKYQKERYRDNETNDEQYVVISQPILVEFDREIVLHLPNGKCLVKKIGFV